MCKSATKHERVGLSAVLTKRDCGPRITFAALVVVGQWRTLSKEGLDAPCIVDSIYVTILPRGLLVTFCGFL
jgi:hypothetical protein